jgi:stearoyl-CoA desaturase (delta-9 desaturase)
MPAPATFPPSEGAQTRDDARTRKAPLRRDWVNILFIASVHALALVAVGYMAFVRFSWWTVGLAVLWFALCGFGITGGYHRLFSHPTYKAHPLVRAFQLFFGAAAVQNSALKWSNDHRIHHSQTDTDRDPYNIRRGFWWAHIAWIFYEDQNKDLTLVKDLQADPLVAFQHRHYVWIAVLAGALLPTALGFLWGDPIGALLVAGALRLTVQWHATFAVNSFAHMIGKRTYCRVSSARDSFLVALITLGEGYHNFHHRFPLDYRNGVRWFHVDPTKWAIWTLSKAGLTRDLRRTSRERMDKARASAGAS